jgi:hypothetical protein
MSGKPPYDFVYVHTDIPEGMTIRAWRAQRAAARAAERQAARDARRQRSVWRRVWAAGRARLTGLRHPRHAGAHGVRA